VSKKKRKRKKEKRSKNVEESDDSVFNWLDNDALHYVHCAGKKEKKRKKKRKNKEKNVDESDGSIDNRLDASNDALHHHVRAKPQVRGWSKPGPAPTRRQRPQLLHLHVRQR
jgi:hypothetical protein